MEIVTLPKSKGRKTGSNISGEKMRMRLGENNLNHSKRALSGYLGPFRIVLKPLQVQVYFPLIFDRKIKIRDKKGNKVNA
jgi:hypothetical protein